MIPVRKRSIISVTSRKVQEKFEPCPAITLSPLHRYLIAINFFVRLNYEALVFDVILEI